MDWLGEVEHDAQLCGGLGLVHLFRREAQDVPHDVLSIYYKIENILLHRSNNRKE